MGQAKEQEVYLELPLTVEFDYTPADPGNPNIESRTCCPPSEAGAEITAVRAGHIDILAVLTPAQVQELLDSLDMDED